MEFANSGIYLIGAYAVVTAADGMNHIEMF